MPFLIYIVDFKTFSANTHSFGNDGVSLFIFWLTELIDNQLPPINCNKAVTTAWVECDYITEIERVKKR